MTATRLVLPDERASMPDDFIGSLVVSDDIGQYLAKLLGVFHALVEHPPRRLRIDKDRGERLA